MRTIYTSDSGLIKITGNPHRTGFLGFCLLMLREAIEPIILAVGISIFYSRLQFILEKLLPRAGLLDFLIASNADAEAHSMIYFLLAIIFVVWIIYKSWKISGDRKYENKLLMVHDKQLEILETMTSQLNKLNKLDKIDKLVHILEGHNGDTKRSP